MSLAGYVEYKAEPHIDHEPGDVNISYSVHPWARGRGLAVTAVHLMCDHLRDNNIGNRAILRIEPANVASVRVAEKSGFAYQGEFVSATHKNPDGTPATMRLYVHNL